MRNNNFVDGPAVLNLSTGFFTARMGILQGRGLRRPLELRLSTICLIPFYAYGFKGYWGSLSNGLVGSI